MFFLSILIFVIGFENYKVITIGILFVLYIWKKESKVQIYEVIDSDNLILKNFLELFLVQLVLILSILFGNTFTDLIILSLFLFLNIFQSYSYLHNLGIKRIVNILKN